MPRGSKPTPDPTIASILPSTFTLLSSVEIASLWSNYGHIYRLNVSSDAADGPSTMILKSIHPPSVIHASESHLRKLLSYDIERYFYTYMAAILPDSAKIAQAYPVSGSGNLLLEDLGPAFPHPARGSLGLEATQCVLRWLAGFHASYWGISAWAENGQEHRKRPAFVPPPSHIEKDAKLDKLGEGVWAQGTYWYLDTRREELEDTDADEHEWLMPWVEKVNVALAEARQSHGTLLHGDVKGANIVFSHAPYRRAPSSANTEAMECALYDLQYVGLGVPTHDLIYFLGTSVDSSLLTPTGEASLLAYYHSSLLGQLKKASGSTEADLQDAYPEAVFQRDWQLSVVDWYRFMAGWGFWGNDDWVTRRAKDVVEAWESGGWS